VNLKREGEWLVCFKIYMYFKKVVGDGSNIYPKILKLFMVPIITQSCTLV
jgi:hypothetical protein